LAIEPCHSLSFVCSFYLPYFIGTWFTALLLGVFCILLHWVWDSRNWITDLKKKILLFISLSFMM